MGDNLLLRKGTGHQRHRVFLGLLTKARRVSFANTRDVTKQSTDEPLITPPVTDPEAHATIGTLAEILDKMDVPKNVEVPGLQSLIQTEEVGLTRVHSPTTRSILTCLNLPMYLSVRLDDPQLMVCCERMGK